MHLSHGLKQSTQYLADETVMEYWLAKQDCAHWPFNKKVVRLHWVQFWRVVHNTQPVEQFLQVPFKSAYIPVVQGNISSQPRVVVLSR